MTIFNLNTFLSIGKYVKNKVKNNNKSRKHD